MKLLKLLFTQSRRSMVQVAYTINTVVTTIHNTHYTLQTTQYTLHTTHYTTYTYYTIAFIILHDCVRIFDWTVLSCLLFI